MFARFNQFLERFRRVTSGGQYIPEIDGLRFVAIFWVVVLFHLPNILHFNIYDGKLYNNSYLQAVNREGGYGVFLFFMISGFILMLPFIREKIYEGPQVSLKQYYLRRLSRLEPPFLVVLTISFLLLIIINKFSFAYLLPRYGISAIYLHSLTYGGHSPVLGISWSLEIEVQFYVLAPFISGIFWVKNKMVRRLLLVAAIIASGCYAYYTLWITHIFLGQFICCFLSGMLIADLYCDPARKKHDSPVASVIGILLLVGMPFFVSLHSLGAFLLKILFANLFFYLAITNHVLQKILRIRWITIIGGMCYSIYLVHLGVMAAVTAIFRHFSLHAGAWPLWCYAVVILAAVLIVSMIFFRLVEQPCMKRGWYRNLFRRKNRVS